MSVELAPNVEYDVMAREWRCTWSSADGMDSLKECQQVLEKHADKLGLIAGCWTRSANRSTEIFNGKMDPHRQGIQRIISADTREFKVITKLPIAQFKAWEDKGFEPEGQFLADLRSIAGVDNIDTETFTITHISVAAKSSGRCRVPSASRGCMASSVAQAAS
mmetsp:Transcript_34492/g.78734  ORF Transcript_34492/g.78734 Transcript_34492/m.78734 type:complete len:163 (-) Transcript_34492:124-612(-)